MDKITKKYEEVETATSGWKKNQKEDECVKRYFIRSL